MNPVIKSKLADVGVGLIAILAGAAVIHFGDKLLGVTLEFYFGVATFSPTWVLDLFFVPFVAGIAVSMVYGLGGKMLAHFSPLIVRIISFYDYSYVTTPPEGMFLLPTPYWLLVIIVAAEFAAIGGFVGEIIIKRTYGRTKAKHLLHKRYIKDTHETVVQNEPPDR
jgi:hypothetical protein